MLRSLQKRFEYEDVRSRCFAAEANYFNFRLFVTLFRSRVLARDAAMTSRHCYTYVTILWVTLLLVLPPTVRPRFLSEQRQPAAAEANWLGRQLDSINSGASQGAICDLKQVLLHNVVRMQCMIFQKDDCVVYLLNSAYSWMAFTFGLSSILA